MKKKSILLVEDQLDSGRVMTRLLSSMGYEITWACTMKDAVQATSRNFDLLISDLRLPDGSGLEMISQLRQNGFATPALALTGESGEEGELRCQAAGFQGYLSKPVDFNQLVKVAEQLMEAKT